MRRLITWVKDNHLDNCLKEILAFVNYGLIVNNQPKNGTRKNVLILKQNSNFKVRNFNSHF